VSRIRAVGERKKTITLSLTGMAGDKGELDVLFS
jgi:hypothetical protein